MTCFAMLLCSVIALGQQQPQWTVVQHVELTQQSQPIAPTTLLTPTESGVYRLTAYFSSVGGTAVGSWTEFLSATDITGGLVNGNLALNCHSSRYWFSTPPITALLKANAPITYQVSSNGGSCQYNLLIVVEQLQQQ
jgi:hypothetical protein